MPLAITKSTDVMQVDNLCITIYSQPGLGKTSLAFTSSRPLLVDFDKGAYRAVERGDVVQVSAWADIASVEAADLADYDTIVLDTVGKALDALANDILANNPRLGYGGALNQQGWGQLGSRFSAFLRKLKGFGKDIVLLSHMDEKSDGDQIKERLKIQGGSKDLVLTDSDVIARISIFNKVRQLVFNPTETAFGKDPAGMGMMPVPAADNPAFRTCLADIIGTVKGELNKLSEDQVALKGEIEWFEQRLPDLTDPEDISDLLGRAKKAGDQVSRMVVARAKELGLEFDPESRRYVHPDTPISEIDGAEITDETDAPEGKEAA